MRRRARHAGIELCSGSMIQSARPVDEREAFAIAAAPSARSPSPGRRLIESPGPEWREKWRENAFFHREAFSSLHPRSPLHLELCTSSVVSVSVSAESRGRSRLSRFRGGSALVGMARALSLAALAAAASASAAAAAPGAPSIKHVVYVMMENHSFDVSPWDAGRPVDARAHNLNLRRGAASSARSTRHAAAAPTSFGKIVIDLIVKE
jgi:hypothetical protein